MTQQSRTDWSCWRSLTGSPSLLQYEYKQRAVVVVQIVFKVSEIKSIGVVSCDVGSKPDRLRIFPHRTILAMIAYFEVQDLSV